MRKCERCGAPVGLLRSICDDCAEKAAGQRRHDAQRASESEVEADLAREAKRHEAQVRHALASELRRQAEADRLWQRVADGEDVFIYDSLYIAMDSSLVLHGPVSASFDIGLLQSRGLDGWDVVAAVPRTVAEGLDNVSIGSTSGCTWGGGTGGNVVGVHFIMKRRLTPDLREEFEHIVLALAADR